MSPVPSSALPASTATRLAAGAVSAGPVRLSAGHIAEAAAGVDGLPPHMNINRMEIVPTCQSFAAHGVALPFLLGTLPISFDLHPTPFKRPARSSRDFDFFPRFLTYQRLAGASR
jgi:hypothetical protein